MERNYKSHSWKVLTAHISVGVLVFAGLTLSPGDKAEAHGDPFHEVRGIDCGYIGSFGRVRSYPPRQVVSSYPSTFANGQVVKWNPVLYRWNGQHYIKWTPLFNWPAYAYVSSYGISQGVNGGWRNSSGHGQLIFVPFDRLPSGTYTVLNQLHWTGTNVYHSQWALNSCAIS